jgi:hypothetical protein
VSPIHCSDEELTLTANALSCNIKAFPSTYLGLPLTIGKPTKEVLLPLVDKVAYNLPGWKASLMNRAGHLVMVKVVLAASVFKASPRRQGGGGSPCLRSRLSPSRRRLGGGGSPRLALPL